MVVANRELFYDGCRPGVKVFIRYAGHKRWEARILVRQATTAVYRRVNRERPSANAFLFWAVTPDFGEYPEELSLNHDVVGLIRAVDAWWPRRKLDQGFGIGDLTCLDDVYDFRSVVEPGHGKMRRRGKERGDERTTSPPGAGFDDAGTDRG